MSNNKPNEQRSNVKNPNNPAYKQDRDNRSNQKNPNNDAHPSRQGGAGGSSGGTSGGGSTHSEAKS